MHFSLARYTSSKAVPSKPNIEPLLSYLLVCLLTFLTSSSLQRSFTVPLSGILPFPSWLNSRSISKCQLNTLLCLHLIPIYLILSKGPCSYC